MVILGVDLGKSRTGIAISDKLEMLASPLCVIDEKNSNRLVEKIISQAQETGAQEIVVGLPRNMDGSEGESARRARELGNRVFEGSQIPVTFFDERATTVSAHGYLNETNVRGKKRKAVVDTVAAVIILQGYLERRRNSRAT